MAHFMNQYTGVAHRIADDSLPTANATQRAGAGTATRGRDIERHIVNLRAARHPLQRALQGAVDLGDRGHDDCVVAGLDHVRHFGDARRSACPQTEVRVDDECLGVVGAGIRLRGLQRKRRSSNPILATNNDVTLDECIVAALNVVHPLAAPQRAQYLGGLRGGGQQSGAGEQAAHDRSSKFPKNHACFLVFCRRVGRQAGGLRQQGYHQNQQML